MFRLISLLTGYLAGNILTAEIVARRYKGRSAFDIGSGNPGMANIMAQCGFTAGVLTLAGDLAKTVAACALCRFLLFPGDGIAAAAWAGLGVSLGHDFLFWHHFRGGKGVATTCAAIFCINPLWGLLAMIAGMLLVFATGYLPVGGVVIPAAFIPMVWYLYRSPEITLVAAAMAVLMFSRHFEGLVNMTRGREKRVGVTGLIKGKFGRFAIWFILAGAAVVLAAALITTR